MKLYIKRVISAFVAAAAFASVLPVYAAEVTEPVNVYFDNLRTGETQIDGLSVSGGKVKVAKVADKNKALYFTSAESATKVYVEGMTSEDEYIVYSVDIKSGPTPVNMTLYTSDGSTTTSGNCTFLTIADNVILSQENKRLGTINSNGFTNIGIVVKKQKICDIYVNNKLVLPDCELKTASTKKCFTVNNEGGNCYIDNMQVYYGVKPKSATGGEYNGEKIDTLGVENATGDLTFFDSRYCDVGNTSTYKNFSYSAKTNEIVLRRLETSKKVDRENYIYMNRTDINADCFIDVSTNVSGYSKNPDMKYSYFKFEGDFKCDKIGARVQFPLIRDSFTTGTAINQAIGLLTEDGSLQTAAGTVKGVAKKGEWFHLMYTFNLKTHMADVYVNGEKAISNVPISEDIKQINLMRISLAAGGMGDLYIDNFSVTGLIEPIVDGVETKTSIVTSEEEVKEYLADKIAMHAYGNILAKDGEKAPMTKNGIYDKKTQQFYVPSEVLAKAFDMELACDGNAISGDVSIDAEGNMKLRDGTEKKLEYKPIEQDGELYIPVEQFGKDAAGKLAWKHETGMFIFADEEVALDTENWQYISTTFIQRITEFKDLDFLNFYLQYDRPTVEKLTEDYKTANDGDYSVHPRVGITKTEFDEFRKHYEAKDDEVYNKICDKIIKVADAYLEKPLVEYKFQDVMRTLNVLSGEIKLRFIYLGYAYQLTGDQKYVDRAYEQFEKAATYPDFNPAHILDVGDACWALAIGYDWMYEGFTPEQRENILHIIDTMCTNVLGEGVYGRMTASTSGTPGWASMKWASNISMHVLSDLIVACSATLETETEQKLDYISKSLRLLEYPLQLVAPGGAWCESPSYWSFAMQPFCYATSTLENTFGDDYNMLCGMGMDNTLNWMMSIFGNNGSNNYGDCSLEVVKCYPVFAYLGKRTGNDIARLMRRNAILEVKGDDYDWYDLIFYDFDAANLTDDIYNKLDPTVYASGVESISFRDTYNSDESKMYFSAHFGTTSGYHQHNDCGTFVFDLNGYRWADDLGQPDYNLENTLGYKEYEIYKKRAESHNVLLLNPAGHATSFEMNMNEFAPVVKYDSNEYGGYVYANMDDVYAESDKMTLGYYLDDNMQSMTMRNEFVTNEAQDAIWGITTKADAYIDGNTVILVQGNETVKLEFASDAKDAHWELMEGQPLDTSPQCPDQVLDKSEHRVILKFKTNVGANTLSVKISPTNIETKPINDKTFEEWTLPEKSNLATASSDTSFSCTYNGANVDKVISIVEGDAIPDITVNANDPNASVEIIKAEDASGRTFVRVWDREKKTFSAKVIRYKEYKLTTINGLMETPIYSVVASSEAEAANVKENMLDNDYNTRWTAQQTNEYAIFDLGSVKSIGAVGVAFWKGAIRQYYYDIYVSTDGENWTALAMNRASSGEDEGLNMCPFEKSVDARYIKYVAQGNSENSPSQTYSNVLEFKAFVK